jgi:hypothetical protein
MLWGAYLSRLTSIYRECAEIFTRGLKSLSEQDNDWIMGRAVAEVLKWPKNGSVRC